MKVLLTAINAKYIHSNLAIYYLQAYAEQYQEHIALAEFTINHYPDDILREIYIEQPDVVAFSCYIWNRTMIEAVGAELKKVLPQLSIWLGGPEVSYDAKETLREMPYVDGIMRGEGEPIFLQLMQHWVDQDLKIEEMKGITYRDANGRIVENESSEPVDFSKIPFPYQKMEPFLNKIIYYESSRGCPFSCSYCLSSIDKKVRLRDIALVKKELKFFLNANVAQVKFVDRTFNCNKKHAMEIWQFIKENDNGVTNFHFEIAADILEEEELHLLEDVRPGAMQFEVGVQTTNVATIAAIRRTMNLDKVEQVVRQIHRKGNIHLHLDLIAGLPYEGMESFRQSFCKIYSWKPEQLQLGFLKVLKGSPMQEESLQFGVLYKEKPPYEILSTKWLAYSDVLLLKLVEDMVEIYYNSRQFVHSMQYLEHFTEDEFSLYEQLGLYYQKNQLLGKKYSRIDRYHILLAFARERLTVDEVEDFTQIMVYDLYLRENYKTRPKFAVEYEAFRIKYKEWFEQKEYVKHLSGYEEYKSSQVSRMTHFEPFTIEVLETAQIGVRVPCHCHALFDYEHRDVLSYDATVIWLDDTLQ